VKVTRRIVASGAIATVIYWTIKLFALEISATEVLKCKISMYKFELMLLIFEDQWVY